MKKEFKPFLLIKIYFLVHRKECTEEVVIFQNGFSTWDKYSKLILLDKKNYKETFHNLFLLQNSSE